MSSRHSNPMRSRQFLSLKGALKENNKKRRLLYGQSPLFLLARLDVYLTVVRRPAD
jgi:hypothetical protein